MTRPKSRRMVASPHKIVPIVRDREEAGLIPENWSPKQMGSVKVVVVIPARYLSTRLPGKPLVSLAGKPMIQRVYERARLAQRVHR